MDFEKFSQQIADRIKEVLPEKFKDSNVTLSMIHKNNNVELKALTITSPDSNMCPTIYLNSFYERYEEGSDFDSILSEIAKIRTDHEMENDFDTGLINEFAGCKDKIMPRLVNGENNELILNNRPHKMIDSLATIYCINLGNNADGAMSIPITNEIMNMWGIDDEVLHETAISNLENSAIPKFVSMEEMLRQMMMPQVLENFDGDMDMANDAIDMMMPSTDSLMYVLSNDTNMFGASMLLSNGAMDQVTQILGENLIILPSSVHECIILKESSDMTLADLESMVRDVNETQVSPEERLSDHVFKYDGETKQLYRADKEDEHRATKENGSKKKSIADRMQEKKDILNAENKKDAPVKTREQSRV